MCCQGGRNFKSFNFKTIKLHLNVSKDDTAFQMPQPGKAPKERAKRRLPTKRENFTTVQTAEERGLLSLLGWTVAGPVAA